MFKHIITLCTFFIFLGFGCTVMKTEHHIILDHNITLEVKIEKEVDNFLDDLYGEGNSE